MDQQENKPNAPRKMKFAPKAPPRRAPKPEVKTEQAEEANDAVQARELLQRFNQATQKTRPKAEKKAAQVAFGFGGASSAIRSFGFHKGASGRSIGQGDGSASGLREKEYMEPWDYYSYYPVTLPLRRPYSGNAELLNQEEFGETSEARAFHEDSVKPAVALDLMEESVEESMFLIKLPSVLPMTNKSEGADGSSRAPGSVPHAQKNCRLDELPSGFMGKMLVYKSGAVKLKLGDTLFDVNSGLDCGFAQDVAAVNTAEKHCCVLGELSKSVVITPDVDSVLDSMANL